MRIPGGLRFVGQLVGIVDAQSAIAAGLTVVSFLGMRGGMKIMNDRVMMMQQMQMQQQMSQWMQQEMQRQMNQMKF